MNDLYLTSQKRSDAGHSRSDGDDELLPADAHVVHSRVVGHKQHRAEMNVLFTDYIGFKGNYATFNSE